jgi:hypothetical protein
MQLCGLARKLVRLKFEAADKNFGSLSLRQGAKADKV